MSRRDVFFRLSLLAFGPVTVHARPHARCLSATVRKHEARPIIFYLRGPFWRSPTFCRLVLRQHLGRCRHTVLMLGAAPLPRVPHAQLFGGFSTPYRLLQEDLVLVAPPPSPLAPCLSTRGRTFSVSAPLCASMGHALLYFKVEAPLLLRPRASTDRVFPEY